MKKRFIVTRVVNLKQAIVVKAENSAKAIEEARKAKFKEWAGESAQRGSYNASEFKA